MVPVVGQSIYASLITICLAAIEKKRLTAISVIKKLKYVFFTLYNFALPSKKCCVLSAVIHTAVIHVGSYCTEDG